MVPLELSPEQRAQFEAALRPATVEKRIALRAQAALLLADDVPTADVARILGVNLRTVMKWRVRFSCPNPADKLADAPRSGRPPSLSRAPTVRRSSRRPAANPAT
jgi:hypothetical protein